MTIPNDGHTVSPTTEASDKKGVAALERAFEILGAFTPADSALSLAELAARTGLYKSTILRIAQSLLNHRFLQRLEDGRYRIGSAPLTLGALYQRNMKLGDVLLPLMRELGSQSGESVSFYVRDGDMRICLHRVDSRHTVRDHVNEGDVLPLARGSGGRVLEAFSGRAGEPYDSVRRNGYAYSFGERDPDTAGMSAPVFGKNQCLLGALTVAGPRTRVTQTFIDAMRAPLLQAAIRATEALGGDASELRLSAVARASLAHGTMA